MCWRWPWRNASYLTRYPMAYKNSIERYRRWYAKLLRLYPEPFHERFAEGMEQTFSDLCREHEDTNRGLSRLVLGLFIETSARIIRENIIFITMHNRNIIRIVVAVAALLMIPLVAMQFTDEVNWTLSDFVIMGALLFATGLTYELVARKGTNIVYRLAVGVGVATGFLIIWMNMAVGIIGSEANPANLMYLGVFAVGFVGALMARFQARKMSNALFATAGAHALVSLIALLLELDAPWRELLGTLIVNGFLTAMWITSGVLFRYAAARKWKHQEHTGRLQDPVAQ
jgi:hypothetical protein